MFLQQRCAYPAPEAMPVFWSLRERVYQLTLLLILSRKHIQIFPTKNILDQSISVKNSAVCRILFILHHSAQDLEYWRDTAPTADHEKVLHSSLLSINSAQSTTDILEFSDRALEIYPVAYR